MDERQRETCAAVTAHAVTHSFLRPAGAAGWLGGAEVGLLCWRCLRLRVRAGKEDPILHSLQTNLSTNVVDGRLGKGGSASDLSILGAPFNKGGPKGLVGWRLEQVY